MGRHPKPFTKAVPQRRWLRAAGDRRLCCTNRCRWRADALARNPRQTPCPRTGTSPDTGRKRQTARRSRDVLRQGKAEIADQEDDEGSKQYVFSSPPIGKRPSRIGNQGGRQIKCRVDQDRRFQRDTDILRSQDQKRVADVAKSK